MRADVVHFCRTLLALAVIPAGLAAGAGTFLATRDRRRAVNRTCDLWGRLGTRAAGIELEVDGGEILQSSRPSVFVINHQSGVDPIIVAALLRRDFVGVAKMEIRRNPLLGPAFAFAGTVFVDRFDTARAVEALAPAVETIRSGLSVAIAPEGTRAAGQRVGRFKKGGFRLAMAAGVPVVPIVICNSRDVLPRKAWLMRPARVRVVVHPPIATRDWDDGSLEAEIDAVRRLYGETLDRFRSGER